MSTDFGGVKSFRFIPRGVEVNGVDFVPANELKNCQEARERTVRAYTEAWDEIKALRMRVSTLENELEMIRLDII